MSHVKFIIFRNNQTLQTFGCIDICHFFSVDFTKSLAQELAKWQDRVLDSDLDVSNTYVNRVNTYLERTAFNCRAISMRRKRSTAVETAHSCQKSKIFLPIISEALAAAKDATAKALTQRVSYSPSDLFSFNRAQDSNFNALGNDHRVLSKPDSYFAALPGGMLSVIFFATFWLT
jgi:hypothetical protein